MAASDSLPPLDIDQLQAAAAEIAGKAVGGMDAGDDAERGKLGLLGAGENGDRPVEDALGLGDELRTVGRPRAPPPWR